LDLVKIPNKLKKMSITQEDASRPKSNIVRKYFSDEGQNKSKILLKKQKMKKKLKEFKET